MFSKHFASKMTKLPITGMLSLLHKRFLKTCTAIPPTSSLPTSAATSSPSFAVQFLVQECGLPLQSARSAAIQLRLRQNKLGKPRAVIQFLKSQNFNDTHITKLIQKYPKAIHFKVEGNLKRKFDFFVKNGFAGQLLPELIVSNPAILKRSLDSQIKPCFEYLNSILGNNEAVMSSIKRCSLLLSYDLKGYIQPNIDFLLKEGVSVSRLVKMNPRGIIQKHERVVRAVNAVKKLGLEPNAPLFVRAFVVKISMSESNWLRKMEVMKSVGWSEEEILWALKRDPSFFASSEEKIRSAMDFLKNTVNLGQQQIVARPRLLTLSIDKRMHPRYNVLKILVSKKLIKTGIKSKWFLVLGEKRFLDYVTKYADEVPGLLEMYGATSKEKQSNT